MANPLITLRDSDDSWRICPFCSGGSVQLGASIAEKQAHYVTAHGYMEIDTVVDGVGRTVLLDLERPQLVHGPITFYQKDPATEVHAECYELWCVASIRGMFFLRMIHAWWLNGENRATSLSHVLTHPCKTRAEVLLEFDAEAKRLEQEGWRYKLRPGFDSILGVPEAIRVP